MVLSTPAQLVAPVVVARGTLSITTTEIYFEVDEEDSTFKKTDAKVRATCLRLLLFSAGKGDTRFTYCFSLINANSLGFICTCRSFFMSIFSNGHSSSTGTGLLRGPARQMDVQ